MAFDIIILFEKDTERITNMFSVNLYFFQKVLFSDSQILQFSFFGKFQRQSLSQQSKFLFKMTQTAVQIAEKNTRNQYLNAY